MFFLRFPLFYFLVSTIFEENMINKFLFDNNC